MKKKSEKTKNLIKEIADLVEQLFLQSPKMKVPEKKIAQSLTLSEHQKQFLPQALQQLVDDKKLLLQKKKYRLNVSSSLVTGTLRVHARGFGFVAVEMMPDVFIPPDHMKGAIDKDIVEVEVNPIVSEKGPEGKVLRIIERTRKTLVSTIISKIHKKQQYKAFSSILSKDHSIFVKTEKILQIGDRIVVTIEKIEEDKILGSLQKELGSINDASKDIDVAIEEYSLPKYFSSKVLEEASSYGKQIAKEEKKKREDLTHLLCITIDPKTAKDFDDAISLTKDEKGYLLGVHIADVAHYVKPQSLLDEAAFNRANSTYFPRRVIPMLPFALSSHLCSLKPNTERLAVSVFMQFDNEANMQDYRISRSVIKSKRRFTYEQVSSSLQNATNGHYKKLLEDMKELALLLKKKRVERGSVDLALADPIVEVDANGNPIKIVLHEYDISHQMIEEFMLKANETVAVHLNKKKKRLPYRIHQSPSSENIKTFALIAKNLGYKLSHNPSSEEIQVFFESVNDETVKRHLIIQYIRSMKFAYYSADNIGHYGLALENYCHFTSPIRRYSDLTVAHLLFEESIAKNVQDIAKHCSDQERNSMLAEMSVIKLKKYRLLYADWKKNPHMHYEAIITSIKPFGIFFDLKDYYIEGFLHISSFHDYYHFHEDKQLLKGEASGLRFQIGDIIDLQLLYLDLIQLTTQWAIKEI